jgi:hypothetical protein
MLENRFGSRKNSERIEAVGHTNPEFSADSSYNSMVLRELSLKLSRINIEIFIGNIMSRRVE